MNAPVLFCHYGNSDYLKYVFKSAKFFNPQKRIILLGDATNIKVASRAKVEHFMYDRYSNTKEIETFNKVYKHVAGEKHGREFWTNFVFKRWFYIHSFIKHEGIDKFWHFDSDNLILTDLEKQEIKFEHYDCTEQCGGICMNGFITSFSVVDGYVKKINSLFQDEEYLEEQKKDFLKHPHSAFTEMRAYTAYKKQERIKTTRLNSIINKETFDDCICEKNSMEVYERQLNHYNIKKLYYSENGTIYCRYLDTGEMIKMNSLNMSWMPTYLFWTILSKVKKSKSGGKNGNKNLEELKVIDIYDISFKEIFNIFIKRVKRKLRTTLAKKH